MLEIVGRDLDNLLDSEEVDVVIEITDVNEAPSFTAASTAMSISEDAAVGDVIGSVTAVDVDADDSVLQFSVTGGFDADEFAVGGSGAGMTLELLVGEGRLDFEKKRAYTLTVTATDSGGLPATATIEVAVVDVDDVTITDVRMDEGGSLRTGGGEIISIFGTNFGTTDGTTTTVAVTYGRSGSSVAPFTTTNCAVVKSNTMINCTTAADGYGSDLIVTVTIGGVASGTAVGSDLKINYDPPSITGVTSAEPLPTAGSATLNVVISGMNFGPLGLAWMAEYGVTSSAGHCAVGCVVTVAHTEIQCKSVPGVGSSHTWRGTIFLFSTQYCFDCVYYVHCDLIYYFSIYSNLFFNFSIACTRWNRFYFV